LTFATILTIGSAYISFQVKQWITFNEPWVTSTQGYGTGEKAPGKINPGIGEYKAAHNQIRAHGRAYRLYHKEFETTQKGTST
jgi:beta-glucosidase/6-phospho-beta-glucosidase/beta-galactosidase